MVGMAGQDGPGTVNLLQHHDAHELMRPSGRAEGELQFGALAQASRKPIGAADDKACGRPVFLAPFAQYGGECRAVDVISALVEDGDDGVFWNDVGDRDRFLGATALGIIRAALANFDDLDVTQAEIAPDFLRVLEISFGKLAFGALLEPTNGGDDDTHGKSTAREGMATARPRVSEGPEFSTIRRLDTRLRGNERNGSSSRGAPAGRPSTSSRDCRIPVFRDGRRGR